ncbi:Transcriptional regulator [Frankia sp. AiPs1]|uniref:helix-turn-helix domain-containing protein n=1 Tax=Frankia sp. AiPa1 TaxID=573492 RepID=UPI00202AE3A3|nr:helix-turn-helix transcriptional regulator [Frankia sp. AiPa1]MCL9759874.1 helix-turn-helix domain-containing protein [Frankia sp. AiPa1]
MTTNAVLARRRIARGLRRYRQRAGLTIEELARALECSGAKISRMETGIAGVRLHDLPPLARAVGLDDTELAELTELTRRARAKEWWHEFTDLVPPDSATFCGLEDGADRVRIHTTSLVPGLLQTVDYARALLGTAHDATQPVRERRLTLRLRRQHVLDRDSPPAMTVLLDEAVLHREIGGPEVAAGQWRHVLHRIETSGVRVRVIPFTAPVHQAEGVTFTIFDFDHEDLTPVVYAEQPVQNLFVDDPESVDAYSAALDAAEQAAASAKESLAMISARAGGGR